MEFSFAFASILLVEDDESSRQFLRQLLKSIGVGSIEYAEDGAQALQLLNRQRFDLIISDRNMPVMNGMELLRKVRAHPNLNKIAFLMITGSAELEIVKEALDHGVSDYIVKPISVDVVEQKLKRLLSPAKR